MENKMYTNGLQNSSNNLMNLVGIASSEEILGQSSYSPCNLFNFIRGILVGFPYPPSWLPVSEEQLEEIGINLSNGNGGILDAICDALEEAIEDVENNRLKKQLERALKLCRCLAQTLRAINCNNEASRLVGRLFCLLLAIILAVVAIIAKILVLLAVCDEYTNNRIRASFCECLICELEKELDEVQKLIEELGDLAIAFVRFATKDCKPNKCHDDWRCHDDWKKENRCKHKKDSGCKC